MRVLLVANGYPPALNSGVETYTFQLANELKERGHHVEVFCRHTDFSRPDFELQHDKVNGIPVSRLVNDQKNIAAFSQTYLATSTEETFRRFLDHDPPELIHYNHMIGLSCRLPLISNSIGIPSIITLHDFWPFCARVNLVDWMNRRCLGPDNGGDCFTCLSGGEPGWRSAIMRQIKRSIPFWLRQLLRNRVFFQGSKSFIIKMVPEDFRLRQDACQEAVLSARRILAPSEFVRQTYAANGYPVNRIEVLPLGIEKPAASPALSAGSSGAGIRFAFVGSLIPVKGVDLLVRAFRRLPDPNVSLRLYGKEDAAPPDYRRLLRDLAHGDSRIHFMGAFSQAERDSVFQEIDVLVLPSRFPETFSLAAREALARGRPVIAAEVGALPEIVRPGLNGAFFPPDDEDGLLGCLQEFISKPELLRMLEHLPQDILSVTDHVGMIERIYQEVLEG